MAQFAPIVNLASKAESATPKLKLGKLKLISAFYFSLLLSAFQLLTFDL